MKVKAEFAFPRQPIAGLAYGATSSLNEMAMLSPKGQP
jgi:hypothetical protein